MNFEPSPKFLGSDPDRQYSEDVLSPRYAVDRYAASFRAEYAPRSSFISIPAKNCVCYQRQEILIAVRT